MGHKVAVLMGGKSLERELSISSGEHVTAALEAEGHKVLPLDITPDLVPSLRSERPDAAFICLHGKHGEDGAIQSLLEFLSIPYVGTAASNCRIVWDKTTAPSVQELLSLDDADLLRWPKQIALSADVFKDMGAATALDLVAKKMPAGFPVIVKPAKQGSALGTTKVDSQAGLADAMLNALSYDDQLVVEEWVDGPEVAISVLGQGADAYALPPVEIVSKSGMFDWTARTETDAAEYFVPVRPASLAPDDGEAEAIRSQLERAAVAIYRAFGMRDLGRVDMLWDGAHAVILDCAVSPGVTVGSLLPMAVNAAGLSFEKLCSELVDVAVARGTV